MHQYRQEVWVVAEAFITMFGPTAAAHAWEEVETRRKDPELEAVTFWIDVMSAIIEWQRSQPRTGEPMH